uniref:Uncharacterized protein n=1 Tax=Trichogramma kaykai TaxID=54128 RepID=A0ABD2XJ67_9HYME
MSDLKEKICEYVFDASKLDDFQSSRKKTNWEVEEERRKLLDRLESLIRYWKGELPELGKHFLREEIDGLLMRHVFDITKTVEDPLIDLIIGTGYKDEPELGKDGKPSSRRTTPIHLAARNANCQIKCAIPKLFKIYDRFDVNYIDESGLTHFHVACQRHCNDVVKKFLELGLNPNCPEQTSDTSTVDSPLHLSLAWANEVAVELLLRNGADPNMTNSEGSTPSHVIGHEYFNDEVAELFFKINDELHQAVHINSRDKKGQTPLHLASRSGNQKGTELLLRKGANPNWADSNGSTPLHVICETDYDSLEHVQKFFEICDEQHQPVQVDAQDRLGRTPLHVALARDKQKVAELLLTRGADRNLATKDGSTPLHIICKRDKDDYDLAKMFFEIADDDQRLVNVDAVDNLGRTPLQWAVANLLSDVVDLLLDYVADLSNFAFPTEDYFAETYTLDCSTLPKVVFRTMYILEWLEGKGYSPDQTAALTVMKTFAKHGLIDEPVDIDECLRSDEEFAKIAKNRMVSPSLSLYDFLQLPPKEAEKVFAIDDYEEFTFDILHLCDESHKAYIRYLCETVTRGFFRRAALKFFSEKNSWLPQSCFENVIGELKIKALWDICMEASNEDTRWLASVRTERIKKLYKRE